MFDHEALKKASSRYTTTLRETSCDDKNRKYMVDSTAAAVNVDRMMVDYVDALPHQDGRPRSVDAMIEKEDGTECLIEFKNGGVSKDEVLNKLYATLLMLQDKFGLSVEYAREHVSFVLVYNREKYGGRGAAANDPMRRVNQSPGYGAIQNSVMGRSKETIARHPKHLRGIGNSVEGIFVKDCNLCDKSDFETVIQRVVLA